MMILIFKICQVELSLPSCVSWFVYMNIVIPYTRDETFYFNFVFVKQNDDLLIDKGVEMKRNVQECVYFVLFSMEIVICIS